MPYSSTTIVVSGDEPYASSSYPHTVSFYVSTILSKTDLSVAFELCIAVSSLGSVPDFFPETTLSMRDPVGMSHALPNF